MVGYQTNFGQYRDRYKNIRFEREDGILTMYLHSGGDSLVWDANIHDEMGECLRLVGADRENKVIVLTGIGENFCGAIDASSFKLGTAADWDIIFYDGRNMLMSLLDIEVPMISAVNGPARFHPEIPIMSDIVIASDTALFQDATHFISGIVPGDGAHVVWPHVLGPNRGRYFLLTGQELTATQAMDQGAVNEVTTPEALMPRAMEIARAIAKQPTLARRYSRVALTQRYKRLMQEGLSLGLSLEALAAIDTLPEEGLMKDAGRQ